MQGTDQQEHSKTSKRIENIECKDCGKTFQVTIYKYKDKELPYIQSCRECQVKKRELERIDALKKDLPKIIERQRDSWRDDCGLLTRFVNASFDNFDKSLQPKAYDSVKTLFKNIDNECKGQSLVLLSPNLYGVGKTHLCSALVNDVINTEEAASIADGQYGKYIREHRQLPVLFTQENSLLLRIRATYNQKSTQTEESIYSELAVIPLLIIDDVGKIKPRDPSFLQGVWFNIIDERYCSGYPVLITTNLSPSELEEHIGGASADRLRQMCGKKGFIVMSGTSYRRK